MSNEQNYTANIEVDARGLACPLPILRAKKALAAMRSNQIVRVLTTDFGSVKDFAAFAIQTGNELLSSRTINEGEYEFFLRRR